MSSSLRSLIAISPFAELPFSFLQVYWYHWQFLGLHIFLRLISAFCSGAWHTLTFYNCIGLFPLVSTILLHTNSCNFGEVDIYSSGATETLVNNLATPAWSTRAFCGGAALYLAFCGGAWLTPGLQIQQTILRTWFHHYTTSFCSGENTLILYIAILVAGIRLSQRGFVSTDIQHNAVSCWGTATQADTFCSGVLITLVNNLERGTLVFTPDSSTITAFCGGAIATKAFCGGALHTPTFSQLWIQIYGNTFSEETFCSGVCTLFPFLLRFTGVGSQGHSFSLARSDFQLHVDCFRDRFFTSGRWLIWILWLILGVRLSASLLQRGLLTLIALPPLRSPTRDYIFIYLQTFCSRVYTLNIHLRIFTGVGSLISNFLLAQWERNNIFRKIFGFGHTSAANTLLLVFCALEWTWRPFNIIGTQLIL